MSCYMSFWNQLERIVVMLLNVTSMYLSDFSAQTDFCLVFLASLPLFFFYEPQIYASNEDRRGKCAHHPLPGNMFLRENKNALCSKHLLHHCRLRRAALLISSALPPSPSPRPAWQVSLRKTFSVPCHGQISKKNNSTRSLDFCVYKEKPCCWGRSGSFWGLEESIFFSFVFPELFFRLTLLLLHEFAEATELSALRSVGRGEQHRVLYIKVGQRAHREHRWMQHAERTLDLTAEHKTSRTMIRTGWPSIISAFFVFSLH